MPADGRAGRIFRDHAFDQISSGDASELRRALAHSAKKFRKALGRRGPASGEVILQAKFQHATLGRVAMKIKDLKRQFTEDADQVGFFILAKKVRLVEQAFRQVVDREERTGSEGGTHF
jgi:hypothetical protein